MLSLILILLVIGAVFYLTRRGGEVGHSRSAPAQREQDWEFGDVWKTGAPDRPAPEADVRFVEVLRADTGQGYDDSAMLDLVGYLGSRGIRATYDSFSMGLEGVGIKTYVLKVEQGKEQEAFEHLSEKGIGAG